MADAFTDLRVVECNRLHSEEALANNNENFALWTNNLQDIVHLEPGDKVSVHGAMVSERGAGQASSIEIKGVPLGFEKTYKHIIKDNLVFDAALPAQYKQVNANVSYSTISIRDDTANFTMGYYINMNAHNYFSLPRRFWYVNPHLQIGSIAENEQYAIANRHNYETVDDIPNGMSLHYPFRDTYALFDDFYQVVQNASAGSPGPLEKPLQAKPRNNNDKYSLMIREKTYFGESEADGNMPAQYYRDPEAETYFKYNELKTISVEPGFNSPEFISTEITRQLQSVLAVNTYSLRSNQDITDYVGHPGFLNSITKTIETNTYKPFNVASNYGINGNYIENDFNHYFNATTNVSGFEWLSQYQIVATKRPELYETGRLINRRNQTYTGIIGSQTLSRVSSTYNISMKTDIAYTTSMLNIFKDFIDAQKLYPEIFDIFSDERTPYNSADNINNSRWIHMNRYKNASMSLADPPGADYQLGWGGYINPTWNSANIKQLSSLLVPIFHDPKQAETYYAEPDEKLFEYTYGCFGRTSDGFIVLYWTAENGTDSDLFGQLYEPGPTEIEDGRRFGFDMHWTAPGTCAVLPFAGFMPNINSMTAEQYEWGTMTVQPPGTDSFSADQIPNPLTPPDGTYGVEGTTHKKQLYMGADAPKLNYDGTHFSFSDLHTGMSAGNDRRANTPLQTTYTAATSGADDIVYKINPREQYQDWTPARKPYQSEATMSVSRTNVNGSLGSGQKTFTSTATNSNLETWRIYDSLTGITIEDFGLTEREWTGTLWELLGFSYQQFHAASNTRLSRVNYDNVNSLSIITTNAEISEGDTKVFSQNEWGVPLYNNMIPSAASFNQWLPAKVPAAPEFPAEQLFNWLAYYPEIVQKTASINIIADNLPTRMIRGYYTVRSNIINDNPFIGGKQNSTQMPIVGIVDKINGDGDFYFGQESSLVFTVTKPMRLASLTCSVHDPDGSYAKCSEQSTILFKIQKNRNVTFDIVSEILANEKSQK